ncbi:cytidine deaminase [Metamycoplasma cloacale]|uniref:Cytidine deaminase n=1 Tax=Metamycoplasma cloacale TaxID=92401 RepID=A0A2Z4LMH8_9BACT|nr:cytidine deaminase [Metamycoplasma cloacale]AWX42864.1 cytidine deaminase [Metamycoplasma cloacale]VEU79314.1 cytidine deaminase [Metamycoplasma cloacale]
MNLDKLKELQKKLELSYCPYSGVHVASLAIDDQNREWWGVNTENPAYPSGLCAERSALFGSVAYGAKVGSFTDIHVISNKKHLLYPCSGCLQVITQFLKRDGLVHLHNFDLSKNQTLSINELVPYQVRDEDIRD